MREIDDRVIGAGECGPVPRRVQDAFFDTVKGAAGKPARYPDWLTFV